MKPYPKGTRVKSVLDEVKQGIVVSAYEHPSMIGNIPCVSYIRYKVKWDDGSTSRMLAKEITKA